MLGLFLGPPYFEKLPRRFRVVWRLGFGGVLVGYENAVDEGTLASPEILTVPGLHGDHG